MRSGTILDRVLRRHSVPPQPALEAARDRVLKQIRAENSTAVVVPAESPEHRRRTWTLAAAVALALLVVVSLLIFRKPAAVGVAYASVEAVDGSLQFVAGTNKRALRAGDPVEAGEVLRSGGKGSAVLALRDGSRVELRSQSEITLKPADDGIRLFLPEGSVIVTASEQGAGHLYVETRDCTVSVAGTIFLVKAAKEGSRVAVIQGEVRVEQRGGVQEMSPGQELTTAPALAPVPVTEEISWSRSAPAHLALLEQARVVPPPPTPDAVISGAVRFSGGEPVPGVRVSLRSADGMVFATQTAADGSYRLAGIPAGRTSISVSHESAVGRILEVTAGAQMTGVDFSLPRPASARRAFAGRVLMNDSSRDIKLPASITLTDFRYFRGSVSLSEDGTFRIPLPPGDHRVTIALPKGYYLDSAKAGTTTLYSSQSLGRRPNPAAFSFTVPAAAAAGDELVITLGFVR